MAVEDARENIGVAVDTSIDTEQEMLETMGEFSELASDLMKAINQSKKATIFIRKEQSNLIKERTDLKEMLTQV